VTVDVAAVQEEEEAPAFAISATKRVTWHGSALIRRLMASVEVAVAAGEIVSSATSQATWRGTAPTKSKDRHADRWSATSASKRATWLVIVRMREVTAEGEEVVVEVATNAMRKATWLATVQKLTAVAMLTSDLAETTTVVTRAQTPVTRKIRMPAGAVALLVAATGTLAWGQPVVGERTTSEPRKTKRGCLLRL